MTDSLPKERLDELDALAKAATPGKRHFQHWSSCALPSGDYAESILFDGSGEEITRGIQDADGELIAALDPDTVRALIAMARRAEEAEAKLELVRKILADEPDECPEHPEDDVISCGWKGDIIKIREIVYGEQD